MNPNQPSREEIEAKLTALLLGELPAEEARLLRWMISQNAELKKLHDELASTIILVREVQRATAEANTEKAPSVKLSDERRAKLLAHFQTPRPQPKDPLFWLKPITVLKVPRLVEVLVVVAILALLAAMLLPALSKAKSRAKNVTALAAARQQAMEKQMHADDEGVANMPVAASVPTAVTVASAPMLAPPPAPIYLPPTAEASESELEAVKQFQSGSSGGSGGSGGGGGGAAGSFQSESGSTPPNRGDVVAGVVRKAKVVAGQNADANPNTFYSGLSDSDGRLGAAKNLGEEYRVSGAPVQAMIDPQTGLPMSGLVGNGGDAWRDTTIAYGLAEKKAQTATALPGAASDQLATSGFRSQAQAQLRATEVATVINGVDFEQGAATSPGRRVAGNTLESAAHQPATTPVPAATPARSRADSSALDVFSSKVESDGGSRRKPAIQDESGTVTFRLSGNLSASSAVDGAQQKPAEIAQATSENHALGYNWYLGDANGDKAKAAKSPAPAKPQSAAEPNQFIGRNAYATAAGEKLALNGGNTYSGGTTVSGGAVDIESGSSIEPLNSPAPIKNKGTVVGYVNIGKDAGELRHLSTTNAILAKNDDVPSIPAMNENVLQQANIKLAWKEKSKDQTESDINQPYFNAKRELEQLKAQNRLLAAKIEAEKLDQAVPKTGTVQIVDKAEPSKGQSFWQGLKGEYASSARIKVENDGTDIATGRSNPTSMLPYDPYFVQTTFEVMQSDAVLGKVVDSLKLDQAWSKKGSVEKLTKPEAVAMLKKRLEFKPVKNTKLIEIAATSSSPDEAGKIANAIAEAYRDYRLESRRQTVAKGIEVLEQQYLLESNRIQQLQAEMEKLQPTNVDNADQPLPKLSPAAPVPQPEYLCRENNFSTFSLNVSDVSFKLAAASLERGQMPDAASIRSEEFINAFDYRDPEAAADQPLAFTAERARYAFAHNRDLLRFSVKTTAAGRQAGRALNLVLLLDNSGSMERADRVAIIREALRVLATQLQPQDTVSVVTFARTARLWADGVHGDQAGETLNRVGGITPEGGTNLEEAMKLAYETARRHYLANGMNRVVLLTDGAANLGDVNPADLKQKVEAQRKQGIALDCFGIGSQDFNDDLLEQLSRNGDGRYAFLNSTDDAAKEFAAKLAGALQVAAQDVKVQVEFNPQRVVSWRQIGYAKHQLTKEQFRDNTVDAAEIAAQEAGNALYTVETKADGVGPIATVRVRYKVPGTTEYRERSWDVPYEGSAASLAQSSPAMRLAATAGAFSEWLAASLFAQEVTPDELLKTLSGVPQVYGADQRPQKLEWMIRQAKSVAGK